MKLVQLAHFGNAFAGSFIPMLRAVMNAGRERGYDVQAIFSDVGRDRQWVSDLEKDGLPYTFADVRSPEAIKQILGEPRAGEPYILHSHFSGFDFASARFVRSDPRSIAFWHVHSAHRPGMIPFARNVVRYTVLARGVSEIFCVSRALQQDVRRRLAPARRVSFFPNAIDTERFVPLPASKSMAQRDQLGVPHDASMLLHFGRDWKIKGGDLYLEAVAKLVAEGRHVVGLTVGGGDVARSRAEELGITDHVRILEPTNAVEGLYAAADVLVMPSETEGMPFAMAEALSTGTSVVATDASGERYIGEGIAAARLVPRDKDAVAEAVGELLDRDPITVSREANEARASIVARLELDGWAARLLDRYAFFSGGP